MNDILLIGGGGHCKAVIDVIEATGVWRIFGIVERRGSPVSEVLRYAVVGHDEELPTLSARCAYALVTVGQIKSPQARIRLYDEAKQAGFMLPIIISPRAHVARTAKLGEGTIVMHSAQIGPDAQVGVNTIINTRSLVEHDAVVGDHCHIATGAILNGGTTVGDRCLIGSGTICREGISIGARSIVGMATRVLKTLPEDTLFIGERSQ